MRTKTIILAALFSLIPAVPVMAADAQTAPAPKDGAATAPAADGHAHRGFRHFIAADRNGYRELLKLADDYDANHDGVLDENELALYKAGLVSHLEEDLAALAGFKALDTDGNGYITLDEFAAYAKTADGGKKGSAVPGPKKMPAADGKAGPRDGARHHGPVTARPAQPSSGLTAAGRTDMAMIMASDLGMSPDTASDPDMKQRVTERAALTLTSSGSSITIPAWTTAT